MPIIEPKPEAEIESKKLQKMIAEAGENRVPDPLFLRILAHAPGYGEALHDAMNEAHFKGNVDHRLKEIIRVQLARFAEDTYFANLRSAKALDEGLSEDRIEAGSGDFENDPDFTEAEKWALRYAYLMYRAPKRVDKAFYDEGKKHFSEAEIIELGSFIAIHYGMQVFMRTLKAFPGLDPDGNPVTQQQSAEIYGKV